MGQRPPREPWDRDFLMINGIENSSQALGQRLPQDPQDRNLPCHGTQSSSRSKRQRPPHEPQDRDFFTIHRTELSSRAMEHILLRIHGTDTSSQSRGKRPLHDPWDQNLLMIHGRDLLASPVTKNYSRAMIQRPPHDPCTETSS